MPQLQSVTGGAHHKHGGHDQPDVAARAGTRAIGSEGLQQRSAPKRDIIADAVTEDSRLTAVEATARHGAPTALGGGEHGERSGLYGWLGWHDVVDGLDASALIWVGCALLFSAYVVHTLVSSCLKSCRICYCCPWRATFAHTDRTDHESRRLRSRLTVVSRHRYERASTGD